MGNVVVVVVVVVVCDDYQLVAFVALAITKAVDIERRLH